MKGRLKYKKKRRLKSVLVVVSTRNEKTMLSFSLVYSMFLSNIFYTLVGCCFAHNCSAVRSSRGSGSKQVNTHILITKIGVTLLICFWKNRSRTFTVGFSYPYSQLMKVTEKISQHGKLPPRYDHDLNSSRFQKKKKKKQDVTKTYK